MLVGIMLNDPTSYNIQEVLTGSTLDRGTQKPTNDPSATLGEIFVGKKYLFLQSQSQPQRIIRAWTAGRVLERTSDCGHDAPLTMREGRQGKEKTIMKRTTKS